MLTVATGQGIRDKLEGGDIHKIVTTCEDNYISEYYIHIFI